MVEEKLSTEERILQAATRVFMENGYDATTTRSIAEAADINIASLHYYFRSKDKLFELVMENVMKNFSSQMDAVLNSARPLHEKIRMFVLRYIDFLKENPFLSLFIISESHKDVAKIERMMHDGFVMKTLEDQIANLVEKGIIRPISIGNFFVNLVSLTVFPFLSKPLLKMKTGMNDAGFVAMLEERKTMIPEMILNFLYLKDPKVEDKLYK